MTVRFKGADLRPVLAEALANQCRVILVKDQGVYFMAERGERRPDGRRKTIAYAVDCDPDADPFDNWWELARAEFGGDDFGEFFDLQEPVFARIQHSEDDLEVSATRRTCRCSPCSRHSPATDPPASQPPAWGFLFFQDDQRQDSIFSIPGPLRYLNRRRGIHHR
ncbi:PF11284 family protein [Burkholderia multivorans ATCC BAA-247]|nr:hypothetical protein NP80_965 [Burkholderia multivorans ATCC BAA-247]EJO57406.1 PF11284 family protein [Burkholderia multivorans ATCC BAA-247]SAK20542.1 hypothetical protein UA19_02384 [Burkholderia multivorans]SPV05762.1 Protein of uncharacterised function (DUF3085) [Burkholderia multivorans]